MIVIFVLPLLFTIFKFPQKCLARYFSGIMPGTKTKFTDILKLGAKEHLHFFKINKV